MMDPQFLSGRLLLAMPGMGDPRFHHSVIALCVHDDDGAMGVGVGHLRAGLRFHDVLDEVGIAPGAAPNVDVHHGGPVEPGRGFVLHSRDWAGGDTIEVGALGALSASREILHAIAEGTGPERWLFALGYAGWGPGQLDAEMRRHGWYAANGNDAIAFGTPVAQRWTASWRAEGIDPALLSSVTGRA